MNVGAIGTAIVYAKFIFLPYGGKDVVRTSFWQPIILLICALFVTNAFYYQAYTMANITKAVVIIGAGWLANFLIFQRLSLSLPPMLEQFEHLIGFMSLMLILLFWMVLA